MFKNCLKLLLALALNLDATAQKKHIHLFAFMQADCPVSVNKGQALAALIKQHPQVSTSLEFTSWDADTEIEDYKKKAKLTVMHNRDSAHLLFKKYDVHVVPEFILVRKGKVIYRGAFDDEYVSPGQRRRGVVTPYLQNAIVAAEAGKHIAVKRTKAVGCKVELPE